MSDNIQVVTRVRPCADVSHDFATFVPKELNNNGIRIELPPDGHYEFAFNKLFWKTTTQEQIFEKVGLPLIHHSLEDFNATLFADGQTCSAKTYTLSGGDTYDDRGIIPRSISYLFQNVSQAGDYSDELQASYIEIYNNVAYDLLSTDSESRDRSLDKLMKVVMLESDGGIEMRHDVAGMTSPQPIKLNEMAFRRATQEFGRQGSRFAVCRAASHCVALHLLAEHIDTPINTPLAANHLR
jgi:kinesin family protein 6/9